MAGIWRTLGALAFVSLFATGAWAADPVSYPGSSWSGTGVIAAKIPGAGKLVGEVSFDLDFGPQADPQLDADGFLLVLDDGMETLEVGGSWSVDEKGRLVFALDTAALAVELKELTLHVCYDVLELGLECDFLTLLDVVFDASKQKLKLKGRSKDGLETVRASGKFPFELFLAEEPVGRLAISFKTNPDATRD